MTQKPKWFYRQSGAIPFRIKDDIIEILLITSRKERRWIVPKGVIESDLSPKESAAKEALEEAGIKGVIYPESIGRYQYDKWDGSCNVEVFLMEVTEVLDGWPESGVRERRWVGVEEAGSLVHEPGLKQLIHKIPDAVRFIGKT